MTASLDPQTRATLEDLLEKSGLAAETRLFRSTLDAFLEPGAEAGTLRLTANAASPEAVVDVYRGGHVVVAEHVGRGLCLAEARENQWAAADRKLVEVRLGDVLAQGGLVYPVESVVTEKAWFVTLPEGAVGVRPAGG